MTQRLTALRVTSDEFFQNSFFECKIVISTLQFVHPLLCLRFRFASGSLLLRFKSASKPFLGIGEKWDLQGSHLGGRRGVGRNMLRHEMEIYFMNYIT
jgi:hypothetical protein